MRFKQYLDENDLYMSEASLSRIWQHIEGGRSFGIITAFRGGMSLSENRKRNQQLKSDIRKAGFGYFQLDGHYVENYGKEDAEDVNEESFFVIGKEGYDSNLFGLLKTLGSKYDQDSVLFKNGEEDEVFLVGTNNTGWPGKGKKESVGRWKPNKAGEFYSKMKGRTFVFESAWVQDTVFSAWGKRLSNEN